MATMSFVNKTAKDSVFIQCTLTEKSVYTDDAISVH